MSAHRSHPAEATPDPTATAAADAQSQSPGRTPDFERWPHRLALRHRAVLLRDAAGGHGLLGDRARDALLVQVAESRLDLPLRWWRCDAHELDRILEEAGRQARALDALGSGEATGPSSGTDDGAPRLAPELSLGALERETSAVVRLLDAMLMDALSDGASDIHLENRARGARVRLRIDGVLLPMREIDDPTQAEQIVSRLKVLAELDIGERRLPQDGRFQLRAQGRTVDFRLSILPGIWGEDAVIRVLDRQAFGRQGSALRLGDLGFDEGWRARLRQLARAPHGLLLVTGPTGSGKTTTLYATLAEVDGGDEKIITIEDPVEYQLPSVVQIPVNERKGLTFARGLRSILRHDPDRILVGEIRDAETAQIAVQAALTGHLVLSSVHANSSFDVIGRFMHMGLDLYNLMSALNAVLAQRLVRQVCASCARPWAADAATRARLGDGDWTLRRGAGCAHCRGTGLRGRRAVAELLVLDDELRDLIVRRAPMGEIRRIARTAGLRALADSALDAVRQGLTTLEEVDRVVES
ncbi:MAG: hypothetical protein RL223_858 [Pseudomonadota bacterium]